MARFDWQTEEEGDWEETAYAGDEEGTRRRLLPVVLIALFLVAASAFAVYRTLDRRVEEATSGVEEAVLASHEVVRHAAEQRDRELLTTFLSGRDRAWAAEQEQLVEAGALFDRRGLGLHLLPAGAPETAGGERLAVKGVELSPDLAAAEVVVEQAYAASVGHGLTETVWLEQTGVYRQGPNRWLYSPREDEAAYWGTWSTVGGRYLTLAFPERDAPFGRRLAGDLEARLAALCNLPELSCPAEYHLTVRLDREPASLLAVNEPSPLSVVDESGEIRLPAPGLVGRPVDEAAYRALARGYAAHVLGVALTRDLWEWACCEQALLFRAILDEQLRRLGVQAHPLVPADYERLARERFGLADDLESVWREPRFLASGDGLWLQAQATVAFVARQNPYASPTAMVTRLTTAPTPWQWLYWVKRVPEAESPVWLRFLYEEADLTTAEPPIPWPEREALMLCRKPGEAGLSLFRYRPAADAMEEALSDRDFTALQPLPDESGVLLFAAEGTGSDRDILLYLWEDGELKLLWDSEETKVSLTYNWSQLDPAGERLTLSVAGREGDTNILLDLQACLTGECHARVLPGRLLWSPDGARSLLVQENGLLLADGDGRSPQAVVTGTVASPVWFDNETFGYLRGARVASSSASLVAVSLEGGRRQTTARMLLRLEDVQPLLSTELETIRMSGVQPNLTRRDQLLLFLLDVDQTATYLLLFNWKTGALDEPLEVHLSSGPVVSPTGRWLAAHGFDPESGGNVLVLRQLETGRQMRLPQYGWPHTIRWSPDGRWFLNAGGPLVRVVAPDHDFERVLVHDLASCAAGAWVDERRLTGS